ncbi:MAG: exodeoxyribonuclease VII large subunit [Pontibacterium sp.]
MYTDNATGTRAISVSELNRQARSLLEKSFMTLSVEGELSNFVRPGSGHWYFTLKDNKAQVRCAMFKNRNQFLKYQPENGDNVLVRAKVSLYEGRGDYQLICDFMEDSGSGQLQQAFELLKARLQHEGLFDTRHKQPLPEHPGHIGIITSATGAAIHDILTVLKRRFPGLPVTLYPTAVQGDEAIPQIEKAIRLANRHQQCDLLILGRGGGSLEDLWAFNDEAVARAVFESRIPVISAVGHEVDVVITDFVADLRAPTPSAAAELVSPDQHNLRMRLSQAKQRLRHQVQHRLHRQHERLNSLRSRLRHPGDHLQQQSQHLDDLTQRLNQALTYRLKHNQHRLAHLQQRLNNQQPGHRLRLYRQQLRQNDLRLQQLMKTHLTQARMALSANAGKLQTVSPLATLERGYAIVKGSDNKVLHNSQETETGAKIAVRLHQGQLHCTVDTIITEDN